VNEVVLHTRGSDAKARAVDDGSDGDASAARAQRHREGPRDAIGGAADIAGLDA